MRMHTQLLQPQTDSHYNFICIFDFIQEKTVVSRKTMDKHRSSIHYSLHHHLVIIIISSSVHSLYEKLVHYNFPHQLHTLLHAPAHVTYHTGPLHFTRAPQSETRTTVTSLSSCSTSCSFIQISKKITWPPCHSHNNYFIKLLHTSDWSGTIPVQSSSHVICH